MQNANDKSAALNFDPAATALNDIYGAGSVAFFKILEELRAQVGAQDRLEGLEVTRRERSRDEPLALADAHNAG